MAKSRFEYVKQFEEDDKILPNVYIVIRIDGRSFHKFTTEHEYEKPNDEKGLSLMTKCAQKCFEEFADCCFAYGESDEFSFVLKPDAQLFKRRRAKILTCFLSLFSTSFVFHWKDYYPDKPLLYAPIFDGRIVIYPTLKNIKDYLAWRQADCHINNLYNTCFWNLVLKGGLTPTEAEQALQRTTSDDKNEILFTKFQINYNNEPEMFKKGSVLFRDNVNYTQVDQRTGKTYEKKKKQLFVTHIDIISAEFWKNHPVIPDNTK